MNNLMRRLGNVYRVTTARLRNRFQPDSGGQLGWLARREISLGQQVLPFDYRIASEGDRGALEQVFFNQDYRVDRWRQGQGLRKYYDANAARQRMLIVDAGANIGAASVYFRALYPQSRIIAIEPEINNAALARNNFEKRDIDLIEAAIGSKSGSMYLQNPGLSDWGFRIGEEGEYEVSVSTVESILADCKDSVPFILKIDIEGGEEGLFSRDCDWLDFFPLTIIETHDWMLAGRASSRNFYRQIVRFDMDILQKGENTFCFNNRLLRSYY